MRLAVIPARGGSKRIPQKNIKSFSGRPIIAWAIEAALTSHCFDKVIVSTDDEEIAEVSRRWGAETPFVRPSDLSDDYQGISPVIAHAVDWYRREGSSAPTQICCLLATAAFVRAQDIAAGLEILDREDCDFAFTVTSFASPIQRALRITDTGRTEMFEPQNFTKRSQDLEEAFHDAAQFYWGTADGWLRGKPIFSSNSIPLILPRYRVQDIDTPEDWLRAELLFSALNPQLPPTSSGSQAAEGHE